MPSAAGDVPAVFAARTVVRPRAVAATAGLIAFAGVAFAACIVTAGTLGPDAPGVGLPEIERYDVTPTAGGVTLPNSHHGTILTVGLVGLALAFGAWAWFRRPRRDDRVSRRVRRSSARSGRWWVGAAAATLLGVVVAMSVHSYSSDSVAGDGNVDDGVTALPVGTGSVLDIGNHPLRSVHPLPGHVALTFDDGPDPRWTPAILDVLRREHVPATFFVIGEQVVAQPGLVQRALREGSEIGVHTYRHREISLQSEHAFQRDLRLTQLAIVGATGRGTSLFRPPFMTSPGDVGLHRYLALVSAGRSGYLTVLADRDSSDWSNPGVGRIVRSAMPVAGAGAVIEMHDGGGDRRETVAALRILVRALKQQGYTFDTVSAAARLPLSSRMPARSSLLQIWGWIFLQAVAIANVMVPWIGALVLVVAIVTMLRTVLVVVGGLRYERRSRPVATVASEFRVSVLIAAYNEAHSIERTLAAVCRSRRFDLEVVVVDDGSVDATAAVVTAWTDGRVRLVPVAHGGKAAALAAGLAVCTGEIVVTVDADTALHPEAIDALVAPFEDPDVGAVSGNLRVARPEGVLGAAQHLEYCVGNAFDRRTLGALGVQVTVPGAAGAYRRAALDAAGGFDGATVAEDTDLTLAILDAGWRVTFAPTAVAETTAPSTVDALWRQRSRWSFGIAQALWRRRSMAVRPWSRPKSAAIWAFAALTQVVIPFLAPLLDIAALWAIWSGAALPLVLWLGVGILQFVAAWIALRIERQSRRGLWVMPFQLVGYRQVTSFVVVQAAAWAMAGRRADWGTRAQPAPAAPVAVPAEPQHRERQRVANDRAA